MNIYGKLILVCNFKFLYCIVRNLSQLFTKFSLYHCLLSIVILHLTTSLRRLFFSKRRSQALTVCYLVCQLICDVKL